MNSDLTFITNEKNKQLKQRIAELIKSSKELRFLVGFFYFSGIDELYEALKSNPSFHIDFLFLRNRRIIRSVKKQPLVSDGCFGWA